MNVGLREKREHMEDGGGDSVDGGKMDVVGNVPRAGVDSIL